MAVAAALGRIGRALVLDCHSFPSRSLPCDHDQAADRPEICIGTNPYHTPPGLASAARDSFEEAGFTVAFDRPFAGALVPISRYRIDDRVTALMVEVRRDLYIDESSGELSSDASRVARAIAEAVVTVRARTEAVGSGSGGSGRDFFRP